MVVHFPCVWGGGGQCALGCCCLVVHWCLFSFGAHMCKFLQLIVVVIPFFHFLPKWQPGNAKVRAKQHRACSSSSQGLYKDLDETVHIAHVLMGRTRNLLNLYKCIIITLHRVLPMVHISWYKDQLSALSVSLEVLAVAYFAKRLCECIWHTDYGRPMKPFSLKSRTFGLGQTNSADKLWGIWVILG